MKRHRIILFLIFILHWGVIFGNPLKKGLYFNSHEVDITNRTSLILNDGEPYTLRSKDLFSLEFDVYLRNANNKFGYILRIISNQNENFDLITNNYDEIFFVTSKKNYEKKKISFGEEEFNIKLLFSKPTNEIIFDLDGEKVACPYDLSGISSLLITFGECTIKPFVSHDVPSMILDDIIVSRNDKVIHKWTFDRYSENEVFDSEEGKPAIFRNGKMLMDSRLYWKKLASQEAKLFPQVTFDSLTNNILILGEEKCISFSVEKDTTAFFPMKNIPFDETVRMSRFIYDYTSNRLLSYDLYARRLNYFNEETHSWGEPIEERSDYAHHNRYISVKDSCLYLFGGYGYHQYRGQLFKVDLKKNEWKEYDLSSTVMPRYLSAMGSNTTGDKLYILGGRGSELGIQELSPHNIYDLHEIDLKTMESRLVYELPQDIVEKDYVFSNNLVIDENDEYFYVLAFPNSDYSSYAVLKKMSLTKPVAETYGDTLRFNFYDINSSCDLYYSPSLSKLIAVLASSEDKIKSKIDIYSLDFPPLRKSDLYQSRENTGDVSVIRCIIPVVLLCIIGGFFISVIRKKKKKPENQSSELAPEPDYQPVVGIKPMNVRSEKQSIFLFGGFQVMDSNGQDITGDFTPLLKQLFLTILLYTLRDGKGISSMKLHDIFWYDKSAESAKNNRGVSLSKLRQIFEQVDHINITNQNSYWTIEFGDDIYCDYYEALILMDRLKAKSNRTGKDIKRLLSVVSYGELLPNIQIDWVDPFKADFSNGLIDLFLDIIQQEDLQISQQDRVDLADSVLIHDSLNEEALKLKCSILVQMGKNGLAKKAYNSFIKEYRLLFGTEFKYSFEQIIQ